MAIVSLDGFYMDGVKYNVQVVSLVRKFSKLSTAKSGRKQDGTMFIDLIGVFYNYTMEIRRMDNDFTAFDNFWEALSAPVPFNTFTFPYNQTTKTFKAYVTDGEQPLKRQNGTQNEWDTIKIDFIAQSPARKP